MVGHDSGHIVGPSVGLCVGLLFGRNLGPMIGHSSWSNHEGFAIVTSTTARYDIHI
jgi:hypothetical protein